jgi:hypothetical protein
MKERTTRGSRPNRMFSARGARRKVVEAFEHEHPHHHLGIPRLRPARAEKKAPCAARFFPPPLPASRSSDDLLKLSMHSRVHLGFPASPSAPRSSPTHRLWADFFRDRVHWDDREDAAFERAVREALVFARDPAVAALPGFQAR